LASASFFLSGAVVLMNALLPIIFFYTGAVPVVISGMLLASVFLPYIFLTLYVLQKSSNYTFTFPSLALSMSAFTIHLQALFAAIMRRKSSFAITSKEAVTGNFIRLSTAHILYIVVATFGLIVAFAREGLSASLINNSAWALFTIAVFIPFIRSSLPQTSRGSQTQPLTTPTTEYANYRA
jgi:cellulose synthase (UDP-forming)